MKLPQVVFFIVLLVATAATILIVRSIGNTRTSSNANAASQASLEAESGTLSEGASEVSDTLASDEKAVEFGYVLDASFDRPSKSDPTDYRMHVDFNVVCGVTRVAPDDPIVYPGRYNSSHMHVYTGNSTINPYSTQETLEKGTTTCKLNRDTASYWLPELYNENGEIVLPTHMRAYYRAGTLTPVSHIPKGLRIVAGDAHATSPQSPGIAGWQCRQVSPDINTVPKQAQIPTCAPEDLLEASVVFPNCWDGKNIDSPDHKSHMSYGTGDTCDAEHPVRLPQLTIAYRYAPGATNSKSYLSSMNSGLTLHGDFWNAWHQPTLDALVDRCINDGVHCGDVSPKHFPGPIPDVN